ncbi:hypothetical protein DRN85_08590 [Methanosarcinales archaeon]|nr:MAG: hypothetical protein DRN85_08590 [Methanosarcinales archaeon]
MTFKAGDKVKIISSKVTKVLRIRGLIGTVKHVGDGQAIVNIPSKGDYPLLFSEIRKVRR